MKLDHYLTLKNETSESFAARIGASKHAVIKWRQAKRVPRPEMMATIARATAWAVRVEDWISYRLKPKAPNLKERRKSA